VDRHEVTLVIFLPFNLNGMDFLDVAVVVADEFGGGGEVDPGVRAESGGGFLLAVIETVNLGPFRPGIILGAVHGRLGQDFHLHETLAFVPHGSADTIRAGITAADDQDILAFAEMKLPF